MDYKEEKMDLLNVSDDYFLAHCISADFGMGKGIAVEFNKRFNLKNELMREYNKNAIFLWDKTDKERQGFCIKKDRVLNLITKRNYWDKPTYKTLINALTSMREVCKKHNIKKIAMPMIGCGLDKLQWENVFKIITEIFKNEDVSILVCMR